METTFFKELGLKEQNAGTSTGLSFSSDSNRFIDSFSPVDGSLLGRVSITTDFEFNDFEDEDDDLDYEDDSQFEEVDGPEDEDE